MFFVLLVLCGAVSSVFAKKVEPKFTIEYYTAVNNSVKSFDDYGKAIYSIWPVPKTIEVSGFDVVPLLNVETDAGMRWMNLDSILVKTSTFAASYVFEKGKTGFSLQNFIKGVDSDGTIKLYFTPTQEKPIAMNLIVANESSLPITIKIPTSVIKLENGSADTIPPATKLWVNKEIKKDKFVNDLYVFFSVVFDKEAYYNGGKDLYAMPSQAALDALDSLRFVKTVIGGELNLESSLKKAIGILEREGFLDLSALSFRLEFFSSSHKRLNSFVFEKDLDSTFYDDSWVNWLSVDSFDQFPKVYRTGACFDGWTVENRNMGGRLFKSSDFNKALLNRDDEQLNMKPIWKYGPECRSVTVSQTGKHGYLELLQVVGEDTIVHNLKNPLNIPYYKNGIPFIVRAVPDSAFEMEHTYGGKVYVKKNTEFKTKFVPAPDPEPLKVVTSGLEISGNAIRLRYETGEMNIFRKIGIRVIVENKNGTLLDSMLVDSVETPIYKGEWSYYPLPVGEFKVIAKVFHDRDSSVYVDSVKVEKELAFEAGSWNMVSLASVNMKNLTWDEDKLFYHWDESYGGAEFLQYRRLRKGDKPNPIDGYWYNSLEGKSLELLSEPTKKIPFTWKLDSLNSGWNLVANPHGYYVDLNAPAKGDSVEFWRWNPKTKEYEIPRVLAPYEAVWAKVERPILWKLSGKPVFEKTLRESQTVLSSTEITDEWFRIVLSDNEGKRDSWNILGVASKEKYLYEPPTSMGNHVNLSIVQGKNFLAKSILQKQESADSEYEWSLKMSATHSRTGYISVEETKLLRANGFRVFVIIDGKSTELKDNDNLKVQLSETPKPIQVRIAKKAKKPDSYNFRFLRLSQKSGELSVEFEIGNGYSSENSRLELIDIRGNRVQSIDFNAKTGLNSKKIRNINPGLYIVRVKVGGRQFLSKMAIK